MGSDQRSRLLLAQLRAIVGASDLVGDSFPSGATLIDEVSGRGWVLIENATERSLGGALLWAVRADLSSLELIVSSTDLDIARALARKATNFVRPIGVSTVVGARSEQVAPSPVSSSMVPETPPVLADLLAAEHCELVVEHGIARGEYLGLELARIVAVGEADLKLEVGVGRFDREMAAMMYAELDARASLATVAAEVRRRRVRGGERHPLMDLCRERWLRTEVVNHPELVGCDELQLVETTMDRPNLLDAHPAMAIERTGQAATLVCCTVGIDIDAVVMAADVAETNGVSRIVVCSPTTLPLSVQAIGNWMAITPTFVEVAPPWV